MKPLVKITVWGDYICPFCYLAEPVLARLKSTYKRRVKIEWRAFELYPTPAAIPDPDSETARAQWAATIAPLAEERGLTLRQPTLQPRSAAALEAGHFARHHRRGPKMHQALFRAYFEQGRDIGDIDELVDIGRAVGINASRLRAALISRDYAKHVRENRREAESWNVEGVPAFVIQRNAGPSAQAFLLTGAQPYEALVQCVDQLLEDRPTRRLRTPVSGLLSRLRTPA